MTYEEKTAKLDELYLKLAEAAAMESQARQEIEQIMSTLTDEESVRWGDKVLAEYYDSLIEGFEE